ncbi:hypothetical protein PHYC_00075 [Phycisphaerales bacterium]|nr:hypothetical protein PHYC_00075 [Phycisphaerales bacterium]
MNRLRQNRQSVRTRASALEQDGWRPLAERNPIVRWIESKQIGAREYLSHLLRVDLSLSESLRDAYLPATVHRRLALSLFIDYSHEQSLSPGEVAMLLGNACSVATEALNYLIGASMREGRAWSDLSDWSECEDAA